MVESWQECRHFYETMPHWWYCSIGLHNQFSRHRFAVFSPKRQTTTVLRQFSALAASHIHAQISSTADQITSVSTTVNAALQDHLPTSAPTDALPETSSLVLMANRHRQGPQAILPPTRHPKCSNPTGSHSWRFLTGRSPSRQMAPFDLLHDHLAVSLVPRNGTSMAPPKLLALLLLNCGQSMYSMCQASSSCLCPDVKKGYRWLCFCSAPHGKPFPICQ